MGSDMTPTLAASRPPTSGTDRCLIESCNARQTGTQHP